ncbi:hypothetical protein, partial [Streptomyces sp. NPDC058953]
REATEERRAALTNGAPDAGALTTADLLRWAREHARDCALTAADAERCAHVLVVALVPPADAPPADAPPGSPGRDEPPADPAAPPAPPDGG